MKEQISKLFGFIDKTDGEEVKRLDVSEIMPSPYQPRAVFDDEKLNELCQTIKLHGILQPIVVRAHHDKYELIAGERRLRAAKKIGLTKIPAIIRDFNDSQAASIALIENLQREGLTAIEEAVAYQQLMDAHQLTQESLAQRIGKSQSTIANKIRLLSLHTQTRNALLERKITERHARALLSLSDENLQCKVLQEIISKELNVKQTEQRIKSILNELQQKKSKRFSYSKDVRVALNTIRHSIEMVTNSGVHVQTKESDQGEFYEFVITIPKNTK